MIIKVIIYNYNLDNGNQMVYNNSHNIVRGKCKMTRSELIKIICQKNDISLSELARKIGQTPQNFNKKLLRNTVSDEELFEIFKKMNIDYKQTVRFADGSDLFF